MDAPSGLAAFTEAAQSRIWAGIHYKSDIEWSTALSREVGRRVITWARNDGSR